MALIECPECQAQISDKATTCIKCGAPVQAPRTSAPLPSDQVITTQQTAKKYKLGQVIGSVMVVGGVVSCASQDISASAVLFLAGGAIYFGSVFGAWWHHK